MYFNKCFQVSYVCRNLEKGVQILHDEHGVRGKWDFLDIDGEINTCYAGRGHRKLKVAMVWEGDMQYEVVQPVSGLIRLYSEFLPEDDSLRFHHTALRCDDWELAQAEVAKWPILSEGGAPGIKCVHIDCRRTLGHYLEYVWASPEMASAFEPPHIGRATIS